jgi:stage II sporulation protein P
MLVLLLLLPACGLAEEEAVYRLMDEKGRYITSVCYPPEKGDEYIAGDNAHYEVTDVNEKELTAQIKQIGTFELPDVSWIETDDSVAVSTLGKEKKLALYCTHSDESYKNGDGETSDKNMGGIYDVAKQLAADLEDKGVTVAQSDNKHHPHDAGAYRRSRQTAVQLLKTAPDAIFDIHRDGIPDPDEYAVTLGGEKVSKVRLLVGRSNQNMAANKQFATQLKAVADKVYPGLIKDIFIGKGAYNQDLYPRSVLLEFGTHTLSKDRVLKSTEMMSDVIYRTLYGGVTGSAGASDVGQGGGVAAEDNEGAGSGIVWAIGLFAAAIVVFAFISTGSKSGAMEKIKHTASEMTGGLVGKKPK